MAGAANQRGGGRASSGRGDPSVSASLGPSPAREGEGPSLDDDGVCGELVLSLVGGGGGGGASSPTISALSSRTSSFAAQGRGGADGTWGRGVSSDNHDSGCDGDVDTRNLAREQSGASSVATFAGPGDVSSPELASPGPGKLSVLFRRASAASQLPPDTARDSEHDDGATSGAGDGVDGGINAAHESSGGGGGLTVKRDGGERDGGTGTSRAEGSGGGDGGKGGSTDSGSVGASAGLTGGAGRRGPSRRDPVAKQQHPQPQPRGRGGDREEECTRWGGRREVGSGSASSVGTGCSNSSRVGTAGAGKVKVGGPRRKVDKSGGNSGEGLGDKQQRTVTTKKELYPTCGEFCHHLWVHRSRCVDRLFFSR